MEHITLPNGVEMPQLGLGVFLAGRGAGTEQAVLWALKAGYRSIDTAAVYGNEAEVGRAVAASGVPRKDIFITGKIWNQSIRMGLTLDAFRRTLRNLGTDYLDLCLLHWPVEGTPEAWRVLERLYEAGMVRAIGVSNFERHHIEDMCGYARILPMFDQVESHPLMNNQLLIGWCLKNNISVGVWSPLGGPQVPLLKHPELIAVAQKYGRTPAQTVLRWDIQRGVAVIPKSSRRERIIENSRIFDFSLEPGDMQRIDSLNINYRVGPDPDNFSF